MSELLKLMEDFGFDIYWKCIICGETTAIQTVAGMTPVPCKCQQKPDRQTKKGLKHFNKLIAKAFEIDQKTLKRIIKGKKLREEEYFDDGLAKLKEEQKNEQDDPAPPTY